MPIDPVEQARKIADAALAEMARLTIAPSPDPYLIWYSHCSGCYPELSRRLRAIEGKGEPFSEALLAELHERFFGTGRQVRLLDETCQRIEVTMSRLLAQVGGVSRDAGSYGDKLETYGSRLDQVRAGVGAAGPGRRDPGRDPGHAGRARGGWRASSTNRRSRSKGCAAISPRRSATPIPTA